MQSWQQCRDRGIGGNFNVEWPSYIIKRPHSCMPQRRSPTRLLYDIASKTAAAEAPTPTMYERLLRGDSHLNTGMPMPHCMHMHECTCMSQSTIVSAFVYVCVYLGMEGCSRAHLTYLSTSPPPSTRHFLASRAHLPHTTHTLSWWIPWSTALLTSRTTVSFAFWTVRLSATTS